ncbi:MAG: HDOD domain-containing protein [Planctomycetota bacterium]
MIDAGTTQGPTADLAPDLVRAAEAALDGDRLEVPMLPETALEVMRLCRDPDADPPRIAELVQRDPQLAARVTALANSAVYASVAPVLAVQPALGRLGLRAVSELAIAVACEARLFKVEGFEGRLRRILRHSALAAGTAREIARTIRENVEEAFFVGLLHDIGKPLVLQAALDARGGRAADLDAAEVDALLAAYHERAGERLVGHWQLGPRLAEVVGRHHDAEVAVDAPPLLHILRMADDVARELARTPDLDAFAVIDLILGHPSVEALNIYAEDAERISASLPQILAFAETVA